MKIAINFFFIAYSSYAFAFFGRIDFSLDGDFSEKAISRGLIATQDQCQKLDNAIWLELTSKGANECIKYFAAGFTEYPRKNAVIFFHGDVWLGAGKTDQSYLKLTNDQLQANAKAWSTRLKTPYIFVARPGTHGSSGDHMQRRRPLESILLSSFLDKLKVKFNITKIIIAGQSGGGHVTASLVSIRNDITCAVPTSSPSSPSLRANIRGWRIDSNGYVDSYEPSNFIRKENTSPDLRVFVLGDPLDANVVYPSQTIFYDALIRAGVESHLVEGQGSGSDKHGLSNSSRLLASWCAEGLSTEEILRRAKNNLRG